MPMLHVLSSIYLAAAGVAQPAPVFLFNDSPVAVNDTASRQCNTITGVGVLGNDYDPDGDPLTIVNAVAQLGNVEVSLDGQYLEYDSTSVTGTDTIYYTIDDGHGGQATGTLTVTVTGRHCNL
ncbi:MAG TPA: Ig-like domain-containing protein [Sphingomonas sp.]|nr:Ig-like domain-containing protein [Sphingomonas sp.]